MVDVLGAHDLLGAHVVRRADERAGARGAAHDADLGPLRDAEVEQLHEHLAAPGVAEEDVGRLDVAVDDAALVRLGQGARQLRDDRDDLARSHRPAGAQVVLEVAPLEQLHDDVGRALGRDAVVEGLHDVRALDLGSGGGLAGEAGGGLGALEQVAGHELDDDLRAKRLVLRDPHGSHPPLAEGTKEADVGRHHHARFGLGHGLSLLRDSFCRSMRERTGGCKRRDVHMASGALGLHDA